MKKKNKKPASYETVKKSAAKQKPAPEPEVGTAPAPVEEVQAAPAQRNTRLTGEERYGVVLFSAMLFLAMTVQTGRMAVLLPLLTFCLFLRKKCRGNFVRHLSLPVLGLLGFAVMTGLGAIYTRFGESGAAELYKFMASFSVAMAALCLFEKKHVRGLLWGLVVVCSAISLICTDGAGGGFLFDGFHAVVKALGGSYAGATLLTAGPRINGIYNDANITAGIFAVSSLISLYLMRTEDSRKGRLLASLPLGISAMGFFLAMSRGAILFFTLALLVWLIAEPAKNRISLFMTMVCCAVVVVAFSLPATMTITSSALPALVLSLAAGPVIWVLWEHVAERVSAILAQHTKIAIAAAAVVVALCVGYLFAGLTVHAPYTFAGAGTLSRDLPLKPGSYTMQVEAEGDVTVRVLAQNQLERSKNIGKVLYEGARDAVSFTIPEERADDWVTVQFYGEAGATVYSAVASDGTKVALRYPLLPESIANRLQESLITGNSTFLRAQYDKDAIKLFLQSPIYGHGLGSTENLYTTVQPFFYQTLFAHNHVLQVMSDLGVLGAIPFLSLLLGSAWLLLIQIRKRTDPMAAMLLGCWAMMNGHGLMEITFSIRAYQCVAWLALLVPVLAYAQPMAGKKARQLGRAALCLTCVFLLVFAGLLESRRATMRAYQDLKVETATEFMTAMQKFTGRDIFDHEQYQLNFVANALQFPDQRYHATMLKYVTQLRASGTYAACNGLARHYYLPQGQLDEMFAVSREGIAQEAANPDAWNFQMRFYREDVLPAMSGGQAQDFLTGVNGTLDYMEQFNQDRMEAVTLDEANQAFVDAMHAAEASGASAEQIVKQLQEQYAEKTEQ